MPSTFGALFNLQDIPNKYCLMIVLPLLKFQEIGEEEGEAIFFF